MQPIHLFMFIMRLCLAKVVCRSMGFAHGSVSSSPCRFYGGADLCGASGSPVVLIQCCIAPELTCNSVEFVLRTGNGRLEVLGIGMGRGGFCLLHSPINFALARRTRKCWR